VALPASSHAAALASAHRTLEALEDTIQDFVMRLNRAAMTEDSAASLVRVLRRLGYYATVTESLPGVAAAGPELHAPATPLNAALMAEVIALRESAGTLLAELDLAALPDTPPDITARAAVWDQSYQQCKAAVLQAGALATVTPDVMDVLLRSNSALRRCLQQAMKAAQVVA